MKDWPPMAWIGYISLGATAFLTALGTAAKENAPLSDLFSPFIKVYILGYGPAIFFIIATIIFIIEWRRSGNITKAGKTTMSLLATAPVSPPIHSLPKSKKFYSDRNKSDLANALTDLLEILNNIGPNIQQKAQHVVDILHLSSDRISSQDIINLIRELEEMENLSNEFNQGIYGDKGFLKKYATYSDELSPILKVNPIISDNKQIYDHPIRLVDVNINSLINELKTVQLAMKHDDRNLINTMITNSKSNIPNFTNAIQRFNEWLKEIQNRIVVFRNSELKVN